MHPDGQAVGVPPQRDGHRRVAGDVGDDTGVGDCFAADLVGAQRLLWFDVISPILVGGVDRVGVSQTSTPVRNRATTRAKTWQSSIASR